MDLPCDSMNCPWHHAYNELLVQLTDAFSELYRKCDRLERDDRVLVPQEVRALVYTYFKPAVSEEFFNAQLGKHQQDPGSYRG